MALSILFYHSALFADLEWRTDASTLLGKLGIYGVSIFFILSGLTLAHVYHASLDSIEGTAKFFVRRAFRICPLLTFVVLVKAVSAWQAGTPYSLALIAANVTGLFGFISPTAYINVGAWSIGNEMVFYAITPALIAAYSRSISLGNVMVGIAAVSGTVFAFVLLDPAKPLAIQWGTYINPFNNLFLFAAGVAIFYNLAGIKIGRPWRALMLIVPVTLFICYPSSGDQVHIVTGFGRVWLSAAAIAIVIGLYKAAPKLPKACAASLAWLGAISYGIYLIHPFVIDWLTLALDDLPWVEAWMFVIGVGAISIATASVIYAAIEQPFTKLGRGAATWIAANLARFRAGIWLRT